VNGDWAVGGIAGVNNDNAEITNCYATSSVNGVDFTGALTGHNAGASILNSIWNLELSEQVSGIGFNESGTITDVLEKTIMSGDKSLLKGDYLIDDMDGNGQSNFEGEWLHFGSKNYPDWESVVNY